MLSILVDDALAGIDISKKYPALYAQILANQPLRTAFLESLELLEQSRAGELQDYPGPQTINLDFLKQPCCQPTSQDNSAFTWQVTAEALQKSFTAVGFHPDQVCCQANLLLQESLINLIQCQITINNQLSVIRLDLVPVPETTESFRLLLFISPPPEVGFQTEAVIIWGAYQQTAEVNEWGLARFSTLETTIIFDALRQVSNSLNFRLGHRD